MISLSDDQVRELLACSALSPRERQVTTMRYRDRVQVHVIARRLGISLSTVSTLLTTARRRVHLGPRRAPAQPRNRYGGAPLDDGWFKRNVAMIQRAAGDEEHQTRYLNGIELLWGEDMRKRMAKAARVDE